MLSTWPRIVSVLPGASFARYSAEQLVDLAGNASQVASLARWRTRRTSAGRLCDWPLRRDASLDLGDVGEQLHALILPRREWQSVDCVNAIELVGGSARFYEVGNPHVRVDPVVRLHLSASGKRNEQAICDVLLCEPQLASHGLVDVDVQLGHVQDLMQMHVLHAANLADVLGDLGGHFIIFLAIQTGDLDIDGRRQSEVQNLAHDVGRLEEERQVRKPPRQFPSQGRDVFRCRCDR